MTKRDKIRDAEFHTLNVQYSVELHQNEVCLHHFDFRSLKCKPVIDTGKPDPSAQKKVTFRHALFGQSFELVVSS